MSIRVGHQPALCFTSYLTELDCRNPHFFLFKAVAAGLSVSKSVIGEGPILIISFNNAFLGDVK